MQNHFDLFHLPQQFSIDMDVLDRAYREVQNQVHPDKFVSTTDTEKRVAMQWATRANEAYQTLKNSLRRATYLCELHGIDVQSNSNTAMSGDFLMQQMEWRETLEDAKTAKNIGALEKLEIELRSARNIEIAQIGELLDAKEFQQAAQQVRKLMFLEKFGEEIGGVFEILEA